MKTGIINILDHYGQVLNAMFEVAINPDAKVVSRAGLNGHYTETSPGVEERRIKSSAVLEGDERLALAHLSSDDFLNGQVFILRAKKGSRVELHLHTENEEYTVLKGRFVEMENNVQVLKDESLFIPMLKAHSLYYPVDSLVLVKIMYGTKSI